MTSHRTAGRERLPGDRPGTARTTDHDHEEGRVDTVVLDVDGTLVDSVYTHVHAWCRAFHAIGTDVPSWRIHRAIGMGGDRLVTAVAGERVESALGEEVRRLHGEFYEELFHTVRALPGADDLVPTLGKHGLEVVLASSGSVEHTRLALELLGINDMDTPVVTSADVDASKPAPDLVEAALERVGSRDAVMVGDAVWDVRAAVAAGIPAIGLRSGGFSEAELREAGCAAVYDGPADLVELLEEAGRSGLSLG
jgi:phosphoglycolate phosphatase